MGHRIEAEQRRQVYDRESGASWYVDITDEFLRRRRELHHDINDNPNLNCFNGVIVVAPLHPLQDLVIGDEYVEAPEFQLDAFPLPEQVHYGFIMPGLERYDEPMEDDANPDPLHNQFQGEQVEQHDQWYDMWHARHPNPNPNPAAGGRTRRRKSKSKGKNKCKSNGKSKKTRKCIRRRRAHK